MEPREEFTVRYFTREERTQLQLQALFPAQEAASPKAAVLLPTEDMTREDFLFLRKGGGNAVVEADQVIFEFIDAAHAYLILQDCEEAGLFTGPDREKPVEGELWVIRNGEWRLAEENVWADPLWKDPVELADFIKQFQPESAAPQSLTTVGE